MKALRRTPGLVVLHDFVLHHLVAGLTIGRRDGHGYLDAMEREGGVVGRLLGHAVLDKRIPPLWESRPEDFHLAGEVLDRATGLVVHSSYVRDRARAAGYAGPVWVIPHPAFPVPAAPPADVSGSPLFGTFGNVNATKRVPQLLEAFSLVRASQADARLLLVGEVSAGFDLDRRLQRLGLEGAGLVREGYVDEARLWALMKACDVHVSLRSPTMGETSGTAIRALALGKPLVVSDVGWFAELPRTSRSRCRSTAGGGNARRRARAARVETRRPPDDGRSGARAGAPRARSRAGGGVVRVCVRAGVGRSSRRRRGAARRQRGSRRSGDHAGISGGA